MVYSENNIYKDIGDIPIINVIGSVTMLGGSIPIPEVTYPMDQAGKSYIPLMELEGKAGSAIVNILNVTAELLR